MTVASSNCRWKNANRRVTDDVSHRHAKIVCFSFFQDRPNSSTTATRVSKRVDLDGLIIVVVDVAAQLNLKGRYVLKNVAPESEDYNVEQLHFHWGQQNDYVNGSEHLREGQSFPLEVS